MKPEFNEDITIGVIGLGYVGLPLAVAFGEKYRTIGLDNNPRRLSHILDPDILHSEFDNQVLRGILEQDITVLEKKSSGLKLTDKISDLKGCSVYIITVPTPVDESKRPDLTPLVNASRDVGNILKRDDLVIYESTVYPGLTEEVGVPILEKESGLKYNHDFFVGYSPERINPGDRHRTFKSIVKVTSGSSPECAEVVDKLYSSVVEAGTFKASSIKVAEAAKVIENAQRDINVAFVNELAKIFKLLEIDTAEVLEAASTKWNFLPFRPGLVGGHCIGVDPYYLAHKAQEEGYHPEIILAGRRINDSMGTFVATELIKEMLRKGLDLRKGKVLILGFTFKENCPDVRNTGVFHIYQELKAHSLEVDIVDPVADHYMASNEYGIEIGQGLSEINMSEYQGVVVAVAHEIFKELDFSFNKGQVIFDVKGVLPQPNDFLRL
ncbi:MAG: nucleotide sugar dehydrogenase [Saprospirales bacterium]|nr:MAG: nucleotide sugar dehydrogenase [Saprospirales bacterium]